MAPLLGRPLVDEDERPGAPPVAVIGYDVWRTRFGADSAVIGRDRRLGSTVHTDVGVMPEGFAFPMNFRFWTPLRAEPSSYARRRGPELFLFGRLARGATEAQAEAELQALGQRAAAAYPATHAQLRPQVVPFTVAFTDVSAGDRAAEEWVIRLDTFPPCVRSVYLTFRCGTGSAPVTSAFARSAAGYDMPDAMPHATTIELLRDLNQLDEHTRIEAKTGSELGKSALQTVCAFANEPRLGGGCIVFGIAATDDLFGRRYQPVGVPDPDKLQADLASQCASVFNRAVRPEMWTETVDDKVLVSVYVPESPPAHKPLYFQAQGLPRGAFRRIGSADQRCTEDDLLVFYSDRQQQTFDQAPMPDVRLDELDPDAIADYRRERARANPGAEELAWSDEELLLGIGCALWSDARLVPTVAGVLLFGRRATLRRVFPMTRLDYIRVPGREWIEDPDRRFETLDMRDPIVRLIRRAEAAILDDLPKRFSLAPGEIQRSDVPRIPDRVVREVVVNALMHRSYRTQAPTQIIRYSNRIEIRNPGHSLKAEDRLGEPGSETRNPLVAAVLHETAYAETKGSGIRVMRRLLKETNLPPPTFESHRGRDEFVATFFLHNLLDDDDLAWLAGFAELNLTTDEAKALVHVREAGQISNAVYRELNGVDTLEASSHLRRLRDLKLLQQHDHGAATFYTPTRRFQDPARPSADSAPAAPSLAHLSGEESDDLHQESDDRHEESGDLRSESDDLATQSGDFREQSDKPGEPYLITSALPAELAEAVAQLNRWTPQPELRRLVRRLCDWRALSAADLSAILQRSQTYLRTSYIGPMVQAGELEYTNPAKPNDPGQKYCAGAGG
ncbi:MAG TPA: ATP-binding protein [Longimicrobium sp.]|nr:ATP-binding protein [Longimicrobium sp.]